MLLMFLLVSFLKLVISEDELIFANVVIEFIYNLYQSCGANELILIFLTICGFYDYSCFDMVIVLHWEPSHLIHIAPHGLGRRVN